MHVAIDRARKHIHAVRLHHLFRFFVYAGPDHCDFPVLNGDISLLRPAFSHSLRTLYNYVIGHFIFLPCKDDDFSVSFYHKMRL